ncbi:MAG TPA: ATP-dependent DNA helicase RecG [Candidatus Limnocylindrales bacterium]|nr:ATP-dependent DNA helicase RecG [Candidatus Limnocylindrales bacterium]
MNLQSPITMGGRPLKMFSTRLEKLEIFTFEDFLLHLPSRYEDFSLISKIGRLQAGETVTIKGKVQESKNQYLRGNRIKTIQKAVLSDETGSIELTWFNQPFIVKAIPVGSDISVSGKVELSKKGLSISSPDYEIIFNEKSDSLHTGRLVPIYPETKGISSKWLRRQIHNILVQYGANIKDYLPVEVIKRNNFLDLHDALQEVHFPKSLVSATNARNRIAFDELFLLQLASIKKRSDWKIKKKGHKFEITKYQKKIDNLISSLPFILTDSQQIAVNEILTNLSTDQPMNRLLQGDVGSGKTVVGAIAMYLAYLNGFQSVLMAPTEILAEQHFETIKNLLEPIGVRVKIVTGSKKLTDEFDILIGTHAILNEKVLFSKLGLVIIDEQQRFGVNQRGIIRDKGENPHLLTMTATPIPRTVALTMYGNLDLSYLKELPKNRKLIKTWLVPPVKRDPGYLWIKKEIIENKSQAFIICPFIEESESMQTIKAAAKEYEKLSKDIFPDLKLGLLHGKLKGKEKNEILNKFRSGDFDILVSTPVVEVGIDIPNATIIMIEAAERFGLAQLHQLRGRVGRGDKQSYCLLFTDNPNSLHSPRLKGMETLYSGAELAELDLKLRGPGNLYGIAQHGVPKLKAASFSDTHTLHIAKREADKIFSELNKHILLSEKIENTAYSHVSPD